MRSQTAAALGVLLVLSLLAATVPSTASELAEETSTLYANFEDDYYMSLEEESGGASGQIGITPDGPQDRTLAMRPGLGAPFGLDMEEEITFILHYTGSASASGVPVALVGEIDVYVELRQDGGEVIATGSEEGVLITPEETQVTISTEALVDFVDPADGNLEWYIEETGIATGALFLSHGEEEPSRIELPVTMDNVAGLGETHHEQIDDTAASIEHSFDEPTDDTYIHNWTTQWSNVTVSWETGPDTQGNATVSIRDGAETEQANLSLQADARDNLTIEGAAAGPWQIIIEYEAFNGTLRLDLAEWIPETPGTPPTADENGQVGPDDEPPMTNQTGDDDLEETGFLPAPAVGVVIVLLLGAVALVRRRGDQKR